MRLRITTPLTIVVDEDPMQIVSAEDASGGFGIQPHHADFLTSLAAGVVSWKDGTGVRHVARCRPMSRPCAAFPAE